MDHSRSPGVPSPSLAPAVGPVAMALFATGLLWLACLFPGCHTERTGGEISGTDPDLPWTSEFTREAFLVADEIEIEGPPGLLNHVVLQQDPGRATYVTETTTQGFRQELALVPGVEDVELRAYVDNWKLVALRSIRTLERPGQVPVLIRARGQVTWREIASGETRDGASLQFRGAIGR